MNNKQKRDRPLNYEIRLKGSFDADWLAYWFEGFAIIQVTAAETTLAGEVVDDAALHGLLAKIRDLGLELLFLQRIEE